MSEKKIADYVAKNLKRGIDITEIKKALSKAGWSKKEIEHGINLLNNEPSDPNFRDKDYGKYISDEKKGSKKTLIFIVFFLIIFIAIGYFIFPRYAPKNENIQGIDELQSRQENDNVFDQEAEKEGIIQEGENIQQNIENEQHDEEFLNGSDEQNQSKQHECVDNYYKMCYFGDVYWYDSCYNLGELLEKCKSGECINGECVECKQKAYKECYDDDLYWYDSCRRRGNKADECEFGCIVDTCLDEEES
jgi:hypothetical protein